MPTVTSKDGTEIAYETMGSGPPLILVDGAMCYRDFGPMRPLAEALKDRFTVIIYDRRGRGESGDTLPYAAEREVEDLDALIDAAGRVSVYLYGCSSGGAIALEAANARAGQGQEAHRLRDAGDRRRQRASRSTPAYHAEHCRHIAAGRNGAAVKQFMRLGRRARLHRSLIMPLMMGKAWKKLTAIAPTLPYDFAFVGPYQQGKPLPAGKWQDVTAPVLVADGGKSPDVDAQRPGRAGAQPPRRVPDAPGPDAHGQGRPQAPMITRIPGSRLMPKFRTTLVRGDGTTMGMIVPPEIVEHSARASARRSR